ncbi:energy-coupling factor transporter transmembrane component T family protein [Acetobacterium carbinolicum]|jgi:ABC-type cobalt transport system, permease component CbiQ and related transporters|uniref:energy-coupling factor transporter transmembrane component T family protein n=1 Tax=Acetobacterium carbinolicum TaxID=52690 RepID=UPI0039C8D4BD
MMAARIDPRTKIVLVLCLTSMVLVVENLAFVVGIGIISIVCALLLGVEVLMLIKRYRRILILILTLSIVQSVFTPDTEVLFEILGIPLLTAKGIAMGVKTFVRMLVILTSGIIMSTSNYRETIQGLIQWKVPYKIAFMTALSLRFIPIFTEEFQDSMVALQLKGVDFTKVPFGKKTQIYVYLITPIILSSLKHAEEIAIAMESRAFGAYPNRVEYLVLKLKGYDYGVMIAAFLLSIIYVWAALII